MKRKIKRNLLILVSTLIEVVVAFVLFAAAIAIWLLEINDLLAALLFGLTICALVWFDEKIKRR